jgi:carbonic anhydrase
MLAIDATEVFSALHPWIHCGTFNTMKKVFHFDSAKENYRADAVVLSCFDHRFDLVLRKYLKKIGILTPDTIKIAGGAKSLVSPESDADREFVFEQVRKSIRLHGTERAILTVHSDCGTYGGLALFKGDVSAEAAHHCDQARRAARILSGSFTGIDVQAYFMNFEGIWEVET